MTLTHLLAGLKKLENRHLLWRHWNEKCAIGYTFLKSLLNCLWWWTSSFSVTLLTLPRFHYQTPIFQHVDNFLNQVINPHTVVLQSFSNIPNQFFLILCKFLQKRIMWLYVRTLVWCASVCWRRELMPKRWKLLCVILTISWPSNAITHQFQIRRHWKEPKICLSCADRWVRCSHSSFSWKLR